MVINSKHNEHDKYGNFSDDSSKSDSNDAMMTPVTGIMTSVSIWMPPNFMAPLVHHELVGNMILS